VTARHSLGKRLAQARRLLAVREERDVTAAEVAKAAKVSSASLSQWESGDRMPRDAALARLASVLGVTPAFLRYGIVETPPAKPLESQLSRPAFTAEELARQRVEAAQARSERQAAEKTKKKPRTRPA
jgi:HTH-type transcriptional regulator, cell division transcriptional repressor